MATIELNGLGKEFDGIQALRGVDMAVERASMADGQAVDRDGQVGPTAIRP